MGTSARCVYARDCPQQLTTNIVVSLFIEHNYFYFFHTAGLEDSPIGCRCGTAPERMLTRDRPLCSSGKLIRASRACALFVLFSSFPLAPFFAVRTAFLASSVLPAEQVSGAYNVREETDEVIYACIYVCVYSYLFRHQCTIYQNRLRACKLFGEFRVSCVFVPNVSCNDGFQNLVLSFKSIRL